MDETVTEPRYRVPLEGLPAIGDAGALVTVVAFVDYGDAAAARVARVLEELRAEDGADMRIVFVLTRRHDHVKLALMATMGAFSAENQGRFAEMHRRLIALEGSFDERAKREVIEAALGAGLDRAVLDVETKSDAVKARLAHAATLAERFAVAKVPVLVVNGRLLSDHATAALRASVAAALAHAQEVHAGGVPRGAIYDALTAGGLDHGPLAS